MAAGLAMAPERMEEFGVAFEQVVGRVLGEVSDVPALRVCGRVDLAELSDQVFEEMEQLEPFGHSNPEPVFASLGVEPERVLSAGKSHSRGTVIGPSGQRFGFIYFGVPPADLPPAPWDIAFTPQWNRYNGSVQPQLKVVDVRTSQAGA
jgi:single-stranded-DNA-specific exonuclease